ncbi:MAG TPA: FAD:protein FMN transferase [Verrucomicrobiae bacterium]
MLAILFLTGCKTSQNATAFQRFQFTSPHMGTLFTITLYAPDKTVAAIASQKAFQRIADLEDVMSDYEADSELMRLCDAPYGKPVKVSSDLFNILAISQNISARSDGAFDVTVGPFVRMWRLARRHKVLPTPEQIATARVSVGWQKLQLDARTQTVTLLAPDMKLDLGGIGKGYAADQAMHVLNQFGIRRAVVAASGDIAVGDPPPGKRGWEVGIEAFESRSNEVSRTLLLHNAGISTSGASEQFVEINGVRYSHIVNPATGLGMTNRIQDTVIGPDATTTDSLDTTINVLGVQRGLALADSTSGTAALISTWENGRVETYPSKRFKKYFQRTTDKYR